MIKSSRLQEDMLKVYSYLESVLELMSSPDLSISIYLSNHS
jgi:hypothetical protein